MRSKLIDALGGLRRFILVLDQGDEACEAIKGFAIQQAIGDAWLTAKAPHRCGGGPSSAGVDRP